MIYEAANRGNTLCILGGELDALAANYGVDSTYSEELDDMDMY